MRLIVCGGRHYADKEFLFAALDYLHKTRGITEIIEGGNRQRGANNVILEESADYLAALWAESRGVKLTTVNADWLALGRSAGPKRNLKMAMLAPDGIVAFEGGAGTADMLKTGRRHNIPAWEPRAFFR